MGERNVGMRGSRLSVKRLARRHVAALSVAGSLLLVMTAAALAVTGDLTQPAGTAGCISETGAGTCLDGHALNNPGTAAVSPDGKNVYVASFNSNAVVRLNRNPTTGAITQPAGTAGCISDTGAGPCADGHGLLNATSVAVSPDGKNVYVASVNSSAVARLNRNPTTGAITQPAGTAGCISQTGAGPCADGHGLQDPNGVAVSPDGKSVYTASYPISDAVARFTRNTTTGAITQPAGTAGCIRDTGAGPCADGHALEGAYSVTVSPDGKSVYVGDAGGSSVVRINRNTTTGAIIQPAGTAGCISDTGAGPCADGHGVVGPRSVAVSPDGESAYVATRCCGNTGAVLRLVRDSTTGAITQPVGTAGCISQTGAGTCVDGRGLSGAQGVAVSPDGKNVYVASVNSSAVARLDRDAITGAITQPGDITGCISETGAGPCADGRALAHAASVAVSADGKSVYIGAGGTDAVARFNRAP
jgi:DNA-binding beta-propeller fold protein YncE